MEKYAADIIRNAQALGSALDTAGVPVEAKEFGFIAEPPDCDQRFFVWTRKEIARRLAESNIICNYNMLPGD